MITKLSTLLLAAIAVGITPATHAQSWPSQLVKIIVPFFPPRLRMNA